MVNMAIVGAGFMGSMHAECYHHIPNGTLVAIADIDAKRATELGKRYGVHAFSRFEDIIGNRQVDAVDICLPTFLHKEYVVAAAKAGKHIVCEKPIALGLSEAENMIQAAETADVKFMVAQVIRFWPEYIKLKEIYDTDELGKMRSISLTRLSPLPTWSWDSWLLDEKKSGSALMDLHLHDTDYILNLLGRPSSLFSRASTSDIGHGHVFSTFTFPDGVMAFLEGGWDISADTFPFTMAFRAVFDQGIVEFDNRQEKTLSVYEPGQEVKHPLINRQVSTRDSTGGNVTELGGYFSELKYFVDCVESDLPPSLAEAKSAKDSLGVVLLERQSAESGDIVMLE